MINMKYKILAVLLILITFASGAYAANYSGFNQYYYTDYYKPTVYYANPYQAPAYASTTVVGGYNTGYYNNYYYPTAYYQSAYYPAYGYGPRVVNYAPAYYAYPNSYRNLTFYSNNDGWGLSIGSGNICNIYGYC